MSNKRKKRNHYLAQVYLKGFCNREGRICSYHKEEPSKKHCQRPNNTAVENDFYAADGTDVNVFEDYLANQIEGPATNALKTLQKGQWPSNADRPGLAKFFGFLLVRTPAYRKFYESQFVRELDLLLQLPARNKESFQKWCDKYEEVNKEPIASNIEQLRQEILNGVYRPKLSPNFSLNIMAKLALNSASLLIEMKWIIIKAPKDSFFLTSDNPVVITNPECTGYYSPGLGLKNTRVFIPISKEIALLVINSDVDELDNRIVNNNEIVRELNGGTILFASKFIFSHEESDKITQLIQHVTSITKMDSEFMCCRKPSMPYNSSI